MYDVHRTSNCYAHYSKGITLAANNGGYWFFFKKALHSFVKCVVRNASQFILRMIFGIKIGLMILPVTFFVTIRRRLVSTMEIERSDEKLMNLFYVTEKLTKLEGTDIMNIIKTLWDNWKKRRSRIFSFLAMFFTVVFLIVGTFEFIPAWILRDPTDLIHLWHIAELTAIAVVLGSAMFVLIWKAEEKPLLVQFIVISTMILAIGIAPFFMPAIGLLLVTGLLVLAYPKPRTLFSFSHKGRISIALLAITVPLAVILAPIILQEIHYQIIGMAENDAHALLLHWIGSALLYVMLILAGVLASTKRPGWMWLGIITGLTYCYLGVIGLIVPGYAAGAWSEAGGLFSLFFGAMYILITLAEAEGMSQETSVPDQESGHKSEIVPEAVAKASYENQSASLSITLPSHGTSEGNEMAVLETVSASRC